MSNTTISPQQGNKKFLQKLEERGVDVQACYQCGRCSAGCPITEFFDLTTMEVVRLAAYGMDSHNTQRFVHNGMVKNEGDIQAQGPRGD